MFEPRARRRPLFDLSGFISGDREATTPSDEAGSIDEVSTLHRRLRSALLQRDGNNSTSAQRNVYAALDYAFWRARLREFLVKVCKQFRSSRFFRVLFYEMQETL